MIRLDISLPQGKNTKNDNNLEIISGVDCNGICLFAATMMNWYFEFLMTPDSEYLFTLTPRYFCVQFGMGSSGDADKIGRK